MSLTTRVLLALVLGLAAGIGIAEAGNPALLALATAAEPVGTLWVNAIRMTVMPLVVSLLVTGIASTGEGSLGRVGGRVLAAFLALIAVSAAFGAVAAPPLMARLHLDVAAVSSLRSSVAVAPSTAGASVKEWLTGLVPANPFKAAADGAMLPLIVFTVVCAVGITRLKAEQRQLLVRGFQAVADLMLVLVGWVLALAPIGVFALMLALAARLGIELAGAIGYYLLVVCGLLVAGILMLYPITALAGGVGFRRFAAAVLPAQVVAFSSRSSLASLPALVDGADNVLRLPPQVSGLTLPVAVSVFKWGSPICRMAGTLLVMKIFGITMGGGEIVALAGALALISFCSPGIPSGGLLVMAPVYMLFGLPMEGIGVLIALDMIPDMFLTVANVSANLTVACVVARHGGAVEAAVPAPSAAAPVAGAPSAAGPAFD
ncbi:MAG TPA: cation:dicarboxylase symporter family transporter [Longimicrobiales bacterium]|nr:cation:dicarboxylase symporter family transporter [Longimicrobiales bacterium]